MTSPKNAFLLNPFISILFSSTGAKLCLIADNKRESVILKKSKLSNILSNT